MFLASFAIPILMVATAVGQTPPRGPRTAQPISRGAVDYGNVSVQYLLFDAGGQHPRLGYIPPASLELHESGEPKIYIADPATKGAVRVTLPSDAVKLIHEPSELAKAVQLGELPPDLPVEVTIQVRFNDSEGLKALALHSAMDQLVMESRLDIATKIASFPNVETLLKRTGKPTVNELRVICDSPGLEDVVFVLPVNPNLHRTIQLQAIVPAAFISRIFTRGGALFRAEFHYHSVASSRNAAYVEQHANDFASAVIDEFGKGDFAAKENAHIENFELLVTRDGFQKFLTKTEWRESIVVESDDPETRNKLLDLVQKFDADVFAVNNIRVQEFIARNYEWRNANIQWGEASFWGKVKSDESLSDREWEDAHAFLQAAFEKTSSGGGFSAILKKLPIGVNFNSDNTFVEAKAMSAQQRAAALNFLREIDKQETKGNFPIPSDVDLLLISSSKLKADVSKHFSLNTISKVLAETVSSPFGSEPVEKDADAMEQLDARYIRELEVAMQELAEVGKPETPTADATPGRTGRDRPSPIAPSHPRSNSLDEIYDSLKIANVVLTNPTLKRAHLLCGSATLVNRSGVPLKMPRLSEGPNRASKVGLISIWVEDVNGRALPLYTFRKGSRYYTTGGDIYSWGTLPPGHTVPPFHFRIVTSSLPSGNYRLYVEYKTELGKVLHESSTTFRVTP